MKKIQMAYLLAASLLLAACSAATDSPNGEPKGALVWPQNSVEKAAKMGTFPDLAWFDKLHAGMTRAQMHVLMGAPQYTSAFIATEWTYVFNFRPEANSDTVNTCYFKILFDKHFITKNFYWKSVQGDRSLCPAEPQSELSTATSTQGALGNL